MKVRKMQMKGYYKRLMEREKAGMHDYVNRCKHVCDGIKDEQEGQKYYLKLDSMFPNKNILKKQYKDEISHEEILRKLKKEIPDCECDIK